MLTKPYIKNLLERLRNPDSDLPNDLSAIAAASILVFGLIVSLLFIVTIPVTKFANVMGFAFFSKRLIEVLMASFVIVYVFLLILRLWTRWKVDNKTDK